MPADQSVRGRAVIRLSALRCRLEPQQWSFAIDRRDEIAEIWSAFQRAKPQTYNGRVLLQHRWRLDEGIYDAAYLETDYASFIGWRELGHPGPPMRNGFAMAALRGRDGAFLLGVMGAHTANAGSVYFAAGTPDPGDIRLDGSVDLAGSVLRELEEETGLQAADVIIEPCWDAVLDGPRAAFMRPVRVDLPAEEARALILTRLATQRQPELADVVIVRGPSDIDPTRMPGFMRSYLEWAFSGRHA